MQGSRKKTNDLLFEKSDYIRNSFRSEIKYVVSYMLLSAVV